ncbi:unnamed protein product [Umbelopsis ramanniana]
MNLRIYLQNINGLSHEKLKICTDLLTKNVVDIICITETWQYQKYAEYTPFLLTKSTTIPKTSKTSSRGSSGVAVLTRPGFQQSCRVIDITTHSITFQVQTHTIHLIYLPPFMPWDKCQSFLPQQKITVLLGDFNCHPNTNSNSINNPLSPLLNNRRDTLMTFCLQQQLHWITDTDEFRHDHMMVEHQCSATASTRPSISPKTDHMLLYAILPPMPLTPHSPSQTIRYNLKFLDNPIIAERFCYAFDTLYASQQSLLTALSHNILQSRDPQPLIDTYYDIFTTLIKCCCESTLGTYVIPDQKRTVDKSIAFLSSTHAQDLAIRLFKRSQRGAVKLMQSDSTDEDPLLNATNFYKSLYNPPNMARFSSHFYRPTPSATQTDNPLIAICTTENIQYHILKYPSAKTFGLDILHIRIFKALCSSSIFLSSMQQLFSTFLHTTLTPAAWNISQITPIPKKSDAFTPSSSRPISLTPCLRRIFESLILSFIYSQPDLNIFSPFQAGFRKGYNTLSQLWLAQASSYMPKQKQKQKRSIHIFLDLEKAYDRVPIARLLDKLYLRNTPHALISLVDSLFSHCHSQMIVNQNIGPIFPRSAGLFQGSILSPWLFNVYIDDLAFKLSRIDPHPTIPPLLLFADDIKLQPSTPAIAKRMLAIVQTWSIHNGININTRKSGVIINRITTPLLLSLYNEPLPLVHSYDYLGMPFTNTGIDFLGHVSNTTRKTQQLFFSSSRHSRGWSPYIRLTIFKTFYRPTYEYGFPLLYGFNTSTKSPTFSTKSPTFLKPIVSLQNMLLSWVCHGNRSHHLNHCVAGVSPPWNRILELTMRFQAKLIMLHPENPLRSLVTYLRQLPPLKPNKSKTLLLPLAIPSPLLRKYRITEKSVPPWIPFTFTNFLNDEKLAYYVSTKLILPKNILNEARNYPALVDISLRIRNPTIRSFSLRWRCNRLLAQFKCHCGGPLNRGHFLTCFSLNTHPSFNDLTEICPLPDPLPTKHYNIIDHALNLGQLRHFLSLLHFVTQNDQFEFQPP